MPPKNKKSKKSKSKAKAQNDNSGEGAANASVSTAGVSAPTINEPAQQDTPSVAPSTVPSTAPATTTLPSIGPLPWFGPMPPRPMFPTLGNLGAPFSSLGNTQSAFPNLGEAMQALETTAPPTRGQASSSSKKNPFADLAGFNPDFSDTSSKFRINLHLHYPSSLQKFIEVLTMCVAEANQEKIGRELAQAILAKPVTEQPAPDDMTVQEEVNEVFEELAPEFERIIAAYAALGERRANAAAKAKAKAEKEAEAQKKGEKKDEPEPEGA